MMIFQKMCANITLFGINTNLRYHFTGEVYNNAPYLYVN
jgi:hypothetical protein